MIRVAAVGDVHYDQSCRNRLKPFMDTLSTRADLLLIAGDLTKSGKVEEVQALADDLRGVRVPAVVILGNHDYHSGQEDEIRKVLQRAGLITLEGTSIVLNIRGRSVGIVGLKGFGGGFGGGCCTEFGEPETKAFARHARQQADILRARLSALETDFRFVLLHYAPVDNTLLGERRELYPFLGSYLLGEAIDSIGADACFHGHAHFGTERGSTPGGVPVRNVAQLVIRHAYNIYSFDETPRWHPGPPGLGKLARDAAAHSEAKI